MRQVLKHECRRPRSYVIFYDLTLARLTANHATYIFIAFLYGNDWGDISLA